MFQLYLPYSVSFFLFFQYFCVVFSLAIDHKEIFCGKFLEYCKMVYIPCLQQQLDWTMAAGDNELYIRTLAHLTAKNLTWVLLLVGQPSLAFPCFPFLHLSVFFFIVQKLRFIRIL